MSREKSIKTININLEKLTALELEEVTVLTNALLAVRNVREEHQAKISGYTEEIQRLEYKAKEFQESAELTAQEVHKLRDANKQLKSQLEKQQPEIPEFVAEFITKLKKADNNLTFAFSSKFNECPAKYWNEAIVWRLNHPEEFAQAWINGYTVAKEKRFYLKHELTGQFLARTNQEGDYQKYFFWNGENPLTHSIGTAWELKFTQQEIDSMETGSYEQLEVQE